MSGRGLVLLGAAVALAAAIAVAATTGTAAGPAQLALAAHAAGVEPVDAGYPRLGTVVRSRAWLAATPSQAEGVALFVDLPDAVFGRERIIAPGDLREAMRRIRSLEWDPTERAWTGGRRQVGIDEVRELLVAAVPTPTDADAILDLLLGTPAAGAPDFATLLRAEPSSLEEIRIVPFRGDKGRMLLDRGRPPYVPAELGYHGLLASFVGRGWPSGWRVLRLRSLDP